MSEMTPELQKYYETYEDLFTHPGWHQFVSDMQEVLKVLDRATGLKNESDLMITQGQIMTLNKVVNYEDLIAHAKDSHTPEESKEDYEVDENTP